MARIKFMAAERAGLLASAVLDTTNRESIEAEHTEDLGQLAEALLAKNGLEFDTLLVQRFRGGQLVGAKVDEALGIAPKPPATEDEERPQLTADRNEGAGDDDEQGGPDD